MAEECLIEYESSRVNSPLRLGVKFIESYLNVIVLHMHARPGIQVITTSTELCLRSVSMSVHANGYKRPIYYTGQLI